MYKTIMLLIKSREFRGLDTIHALTFQRYCSHIDFSTTLFMHTLFIRSEFPEFTMNFLLRSSLRSIFFGHHRVPPSPNITIARPPITNHCVSIDLAFPLDDELLAEHEVRWEAMISPGNEGLVMGKRLGC
ncbi:hypothetical protein Droror1_Dr00022631 [Drosera rotundifolia]